VGEGWGEACLAVAVGEGWGEGEGVGVAVGDSIFSARTSESIFLEARARYENGIPVKSVPITKAIIIPISFYQPLPYPDS